MAKLVGANALRCAGSGIATRTAERLFGGTSDGRTKLKSVVRSLALQDLPRARARHLRGGAGEDAGGGGARGVAL